MALELTEQQISISHRLPPTKNVKDRMIVKFIHRDTRDEFYRRKSRLTGKTAKDLPLIAQELGTRNTGKIHINESLTTYRKRLFGRVNAFKRERHFKYIWTINGKILLRETDVSTIYGFTRVEEFEEFEQNR